MANKIIKAQMQQRRDTKANWATQNPVLLAGEFGIVSDDPNLYKVGDGTTHWNALPFRGFNGTVVNETGTSEAVVMSQKAVTEKLTELGGQVTQNYTTTTTTSYERLSPLPFSLLKGATVKNNGETYLIIADDSTLANRQDVAAGNSIVLTTDKNYVGTGENEGKVDFDYIPPLIAKNAEDIAKNAEDIAKGVYYFFSEKKDDIAYGALNRVNFSPDVPKGNYIISVDFNFAAAYANTIYVYYGDGDGYEEIPVQRRKQGTEIIHTSYGKRPIGVSVAVSSLISDDTNGYIEYKFGAYADTALNNINASIDAKDNALGIYAVYVGTDYGYVPFNYPLKQGTIIENRGESTLICGSDSSFTQRINIPSGAKITLPFDINCVNTFLKGMVIVYIDSVLSQVSKNTEDIDNLKNNLNIGSVDISLPNTIYAIVGDTLQLFFRGMIKAIDPYKYDILIACSKGKKYPRYFEYTPTIEDVGETNFIITVKDDNRNVLSSKTCKLITCNVVKSPTNNINVACFGDSLTGAGYWCAEADRRLTEIGGIPDGQALNNISFVGQKKNGKTGYFGVGGWTWDNYTKKGSPAYRFNVTNVQSLSVGATYTNNGNTFTIIEVNVTNGTGNILCSVKNLLPIPTTSGVLTKSSGAGDNTINYTSVEEDSQNPLWDYDNNKMTFIPYANKYANGKIDVVYTLLSWNGQTPGRVDFTSVIEQIKIFADTLHAEFPQAKLKLMGVQVPSVRGGMGANYGATGTSYADGYGMVVTALNQNEAYQEFANRAEYSAFVEFVNISAEFDTDYNMPHAQQKVNVRSEVTEWLDTNGVHPNQDGYMQIADVVYRNIIANYCQ